jgi:hypothetical protein
MDVERELALAIIENRIERLADGSFVVRCASPSISQPSLATNQQNRTAGRRILYGTVLVFEHDFALEDAIGSHAHSLEANMRATNSTPLGIPLFLPLSP